MPNISGQDAVDKLKKAGFYVARQRGSHVVLKKRSAGGDIGCVVPLHKELAMGTLHSILKQAKIEMNEFLNL